MGTLSSKRCIESHQDAICHDAAEKIKKELSFWQVMKFGCTFLNPILGLIMNSPSKRKLNHGQLLLSIKCLQKKDLYTEESGNNDSITGSQNQNSLLVTNQLTYIYQGQRMRGLFSRSHQ